MVAKTIDKPLIKPNIHFTFNWDISRGRHDGGEVGTKEKKLLISKFELQNSGCDLSASAAYTPVFTVYDTHPVY